MTDAAAPELSRRPARPPVWLWLWLPLLIYPGLLISLWLAEDFWSMMTRKEGGVEFLSFALGLLGVGYGVAVWRRRRALPESQGWLAYWFAAVTLGTFFLAGEEVSWGQHLGFWNSEQLPEAVKRVNDQNETNFHTITNALDQGPTNLVVGATLIG
ncbi:MAG: hypothetical protein R3336_04925, partial [Phycisphaeraceae bacterium]|nr:hypothetical protein [Phycisphaeraceae bacterium]